MNPKEIKTLKRWILRRNTGIRDVKLAFNGDIYWEVAINEEFMYFDNNARRILRVKIPLTVENFFDALVQDVQEG